MDILLTSMKVHLFTKTFQSSQSVYRTKEQSCYLSWKAPVKEFVKINCDAAWISSDSLTGIGVISRDQQHCYVSKISYFQQYQQLLIRS